MGLLQRRHCLTLLPTSLSSKDVQNSVCSRLSFIAGLLVQRWEADFKEKWALQNEARRRWDVLSAHRLHHRWWWWQLHYHGCQPPGGEAGFCAVLHWGRSTWCHCEWDLEKCQLLRIAEENEWGALWLCVTRAQLKRPVSHGWVTQVLGLCQRTLEISVHYVPDVLG